MIKSLCCILSQTIIFTARVSTACPLISHNELTGTYSKSGDSWLRHYLFLYSNHYFTCKLPCYPFLRFQFSLSPLFTVVIILLGITSIISIFLQQDSFGLAIILRIDLSLPINSALPIYRTSFFFAHPPLPLVFIHSYFISFFTLFCFLCTCSLFSALSVTVTINILSLGIHLANSVVAILQF